MRIREIMWVFILMLAAGMKSIAQSDNDECIYAEFIPDVEEYCSEPKQFSNEEATESSQVKPFCWPQGTGTNDVWFSFIPKNNAFYIQLTGQNANGDGTLIKPSMVIYTGKCSNLEEVACGSILFNENLLELTITDVRIGQLYYVRIDGRSNNTGSFKLCINTFSPPKPPEADCDKGVVLCNKDPFYVKNLAGIGQDVNEIEPTACIKEEFASVWYKWTCKDAGSLSFKISPNNFKEDDIDFIVYELPGGLDDCANKMRIRCMASGESIGGSPATNAPCFEDTGLSLTSTDLEEFPGCSPGDDNYVAALQMETGKSYALIINNFSKSGYGFSIEFGGTGTFLGPESDFETEFVNAIECDKTINFINKSASFTDSIISYKWNFGSGADKNSSTEFGPHSVVYNSFGFKTAALTVESKRGCIVTKVKDFFVNPCCRDTSTLGVDAQSVDLVCFDDDSGIILGKGLRGAPEYTFSIDSINFQPNPRFKNLSAGDYVLYIRDSKGCVNQMNITLNQPPKLMADAGETIHVELGDPFVLNGSFVPPNPTTNVQWSPPTGLDASNILDPSGTALQSNVYQILVQDENGCTDVDSVELRVSKNVTIKAPNIISANLDGDNDFFNIDGNKAIREIELLRIFDRWGNIMYVGSKLEKGNMSIGWNGTCNGVFVVPGVYVWMAEVRLIDEDLLIYTGDVTVVR